MGVGKPNNLFRFIVDTGSTTALLIDKECHKTACENHKQYQKLTTLAKVFNLDEKINYGRGYVDYHLAADTFYYNQFEIPEQMFGRVVDQDQVFDQVIFIFMPG